MRIGYACLVEALKDGDFKSCILKNADEDRLKSLIKYNLESLDRIFDYNYRNGIRLFRISSDLIPFGSREGVYNFSWEEYFSEEFKKLGEKIGRYDLRVSMHPGQYTVINSPREEVVKNSIRDLDYHARFLEALTAGRDGKIILHIGGVYGDKEAAKERFIDNYKSLSQSIRDRLVIENDDRSYTIEDVLDISRRTGSPVVFDNLHHRINSPETKLADREWIGLAGETWQEEDGNQKIHYSQQAVGKRPGSHSASIDLNEFMDYYKDIEDLGPDIMLEVKDKNISALKLINSLREDRDIKYLEWEWARYKYSILDRSQRDYSYIRELLKDKTSYPVEEFYGRIEDVISRDKAPADYENGLLHVWGYFKDLASPREKTKFMREMDRLRKNEIEVSKLKRTLNTMAKKYDVDFLLNSYYFSI